LDIVKPSELEFPITVIGAGGIGSWATLALAKMGCQNLHVVDFDKVEAKNTPSQIYTVDQIGKNKVEALQETVLHLTGTKISYHVGKFQELLQKDKVLPSVIIVSVDSIAERQKIWESINEAWKADPSLQCYIDARMGGELLRVLVVNPHDPESVEYYNKKLFMKKKHHEESCTAKAIVYNTFFSGGLIASVVKKFAKKQETKFDFYFDIVNAEIY
jgi:hypothetical protein